MKQVDWVEELQENEKEFVLVETINQTRFRYVIEVPKGKQDWALDVVVMEKSKEFSQEFLGENIVSSRIIDDNEIISLCDIDNKYATRWDKETKLKNFVTFQEDYD